MSDKGSLSFHNFVLVQSIRRNKEFGNPHILDKVVEHFHIDQFGSNFRKDVFDPKEITAVRTNACWMFLSGAYFSILYAMLCYFRKSLKKV